MKREFILEAKISEKSNNSPLPENKHEFESAVIEALEKLLPQDMRDIYGVEITVQIKAVRYGSLIVFFGVTVAGLNALSRYKNLYDSIELIRHHADSALNALQRRFGNFNVSVSIRSPHLHDPYNRHHFLENELFLEELAPSPIRRSARDGFFYFLLVWGIASLLVIAVLVFAAVRKTYFP